MDHRRDKLDSDHGDDFLREMGDGELDYVYPVGTYVFVRSITVMWLEEGVNPRQPITVFMTFETRDEAEKYMKPLWEDETIIDLVGIAEGGYYRLVEKEDDEEEKDEEKEEDDYSESYYDETY